MGKINGIIIEGKVYEAVPKGSYHCSDCDLFQSCPNSFGGYCIAIGKYQHIFRYSQPLTDKINEK